MPYRRLNRKFSSLSLEDLTVVKATKSHLNASAARIYDLKFQKKIFQDNAKKECKRITSIVEREFSALSLLNLDSDEYSSDCEVKSDGAETTLEFDESEWTDEDLSDSKDDPNDLEETSNETQDTLEFDESQWTAEDLVFGSNDDDLNDSEEISDLDRTHESVDDLHDSEDSNCMPMDLEC